jgi:hypothetical protein
MGIKPFSQYLSEAEEPHEYVVKIMVRGLEGGAYNQCHVNCQWLNMEETPKCLLFKTGLKMDKLDSGASYPMRTDMCKSTTDSLT